MIARLTGKVIAREAKALVVDVHGVGYRIAVLAEVREGVRRGDEVTLRIHHHISADAQALYGFTKHRELHYFQLLLTVPSVGPRTAMGILEEAPPQVLEQAVAEEDTTVLTKVSGVGRKTAERLLVELKEKIVAPVAGAAGGIQRESLEALISIGFTPGQAREAVRRLPKNVRTVEEAVKIALQSQRVST